MARLDPQPQVMECAQWPDGSSYRLIDSGAGRKWEGFGPYSFIRPEPQALWQPRREDWQAEGEFIPGSDEDGGGRWAFARDVPPDGWELAWNEVRFTAQPTPFRHLAFFPDMAPVWEWMRAQLSPPPLQGRGPGGGGVPQDTAPAESAPPQPLP
jgi:23S rRNA (cytosine1962-C5)-methyltransferase